MPVSFFPYVVIYPLTILALLTTQREQHIHCVNFEQLAKRFLFQDTGETSVDRTEHRADPSPELRMRLVRAALVQCNCDQCPESFKMNQIVLAFASTKETHCLGDMRFIPYGTQMSAVSSRNALDWTDIRHQNKFGIRHSPLTSVLFFFELLILIGIN